MGDAEIQHPQAPLSLWRQRVGWRPPYPLALPYLQMPPRRQQWSLALPVACSYMNRGAAASLDLPGGAEICNLAIFLNGHGKLMW